MLVLNGRPLGIHVLSERVTDGFFLRRLGHCLGSRDPSRCRGDLGPIPKRFRVERLLVDDDLAQPSRLGRLDGRPRRTIAQPVEPGGEGDPTGLDVE